MARLTVLLLLLFAQWARPQEVADVDVPETATPTVGSRESATPRTTEPTQESRCTALQKSIAPLDGGKRLWNVTDAFLEDDDLQTVIDCAREGDTINLQTKDTVRPRRRLIISRSLKIRGTSDGSSLSCPSEDGLMLISAVNVTLDGLIIKDCLLNADDTDAGVIETTACPSGVLAVIEMKNTVFRNNVHRRGSATVTVVDHQCFSVFMKEVTFDSNQYAESGCLGMRNSLIDVQMIDNANIGDDRMSLLWFPNGSVTAVDRWTAENNKGTLVGLEGGSIVIRNANVTLTSTIRRGAIFANRSDVRIEDATFSSNECKGRGAAVFLKEDSNGTFQDVHFLENLAINGSSAVHADDPGHMEFTNCTFRENKGFGDQCDEEPYSGGCIAIMGTKAASESTSLDVTDCTFEDNLGCEGQAVSILLWSKARVSITRARFVRNISHRRCRFFCQVFPWKGAAVDVRNSTDTDFALTDCQFENNEGHSDVTLYESGGNSSINSVKFVNRPGSSGNGSAIHIELPSATENLKVIIDAVEIVNRDNGKEHGGMIYLNGARIGASLNDCTVVGSIGYRSIASYNLNPLSISKSRFEDNKGNKNGAAMLLIGTQNIRIEDCIFKNNTSPNSGGAVYSDASMMVLRSTFSSNNATEEGGAVRVESSTPAVSLLKDCVFTNNTATAGGAVSISGSGFSRSAVVDCTVEDNEATALGGGIYVRLDDKDDRFFLHNSTLRRNRADVGGGAFFQFDGKQLDGLSFTGSNFGDNVWLNSDKYFSLANTTFVDNFAVRGGGGFYVDDRRALEIDCELTPMEGKNKKQWTPDNRLQCKSLRDNYAFSKNGINLATSASGLRFKLDDNSWIDPPHTIDISNHTGGHPLPKIDFFLLDQFEQGPALTRSKTPVRGTVTGAVHGFLNYVQATVTSENDLFPTTLFTKVENGRGTIQLPPPYQMPGNYTLVASIEGDEALNLTIRVRLRHCIVNEYIGDPLCLNCTGSQYNFHPKDRSCRSCPEDGDCSSAFVLPKSGRWNAFPCSHHVQKCTYKDACIGIEANFTELPMLTRPNCSFDTSALKEYSKKQCTHGYTDVLCGSCDASHGRLGFTCIDCPATVHSILVIVAIVVGIAVIVSLQIHGNLEAALLPFNGLSKDPSATISEGHLHLRQSMSGGHRTLSDAAIREKEDNAKGRFVELLKIAVNYLQTITVGLTLDVSWNSSLLKLIGGMDGIDGAVVETSTFALDCILPSSSSVPRSVLRQAIIVCLPLLVFLALSLMWIVVSLLREKPAIFAVKRITLTSAVVLYVSYISLVRVAVNGFNCIDVYDGRRLDDVDIVHDRWALDTSVVCFEGSHKTLVSALCLPMLVINLMLPISLAYGLISVRRASKLDSKVIQETIGLFFRGFEERWVFWDAVILLRKALLAIIVVFAYSLGGNLQGLLACSLLVISLCFQLELHPFKSNLKHLNLMESLSLFASSFTFLGGVILNDPMMNSSIIEAVFVIVIFVGNVALVLAFICILIKAKTEQMGYRLLRNGIECDAENFLAVFLALHWLYRIKLRRLYKKAVATHRAVADDGDDPSKMNSIQMSGFS